MSVHAYFAEVEAVASVLDEYASRQDASQPYKRPTEDEFTAIWQSVELLMRAYQVLVPLIQLEMSKQALVLPDVQEKPSGLILPGDEPLPGL